MKYPWAQQMQHCYALLSPGVEGSGFRCVCKVINVTSNAATVTYLEFITWSNLNKRVIGALLDTQYINCLIKYKLCACLHF